jgi:hypothetical protein
VAGDFDAAEYVSDATAFVDDEGGAFDAEDFFAVHGFFLDDAIEPADGTVGVAQKRVGQGDFGAEFLVGGQAVAADAEDYGPGGDDFGVDVAKLASFVSSAGGVVFRVEEEDDFFAAVGAEARRRPAGGREGEVRRRCSFAEFAHFITFFRYNFPYV